MKLGLYSAWLLSGLFAGSRSPRLRPHWFLRSAKAAGSSPARHSRSVHRSDRHLRPIRRLDYRHHGAGRRWLGSKELIGRSAEPFGFPPQLPGPHAIRRGGPKRFCNRRQAVVSPAPPAPEPKQGESVPASRPTTCSERRLAGTDSPPRFRVQRTSSALRILTLNCSPRRGPA